MPKQGPRLAGFAPLLGLLPLLGGVTTGQAALAASGALDEAKQAGRGPESFPPADEDYFRETDNGVELTPDEVKGRNMWLVWTGGNDRFWDLLTRNTFRAFDLLKTISSHPSLPAKRGNRWRYLGLVNEPCFEQATGPDPERFGLWLDKRRVDCPPDPFASATASTPAWPPARAAGTCRSARTTASPRASWA